MSTKTTNIDLLKMDPATDGDATFNIATMLNDNWDKVDSAVAGRETLLKDKAPKTAPGDDDSIAIIEPAGAVKKTTWLQLKTLLKSFFDLKYAGLTHKSRHMPGGGDALAPADIGALSTTGDAKDLSVTFLEGDKVNIATGDKLSAVMGKLSRWFASFGAAAWLGVGTAVNTVAAGDHGHAFADISDKPTSFAPSVHKSTHSVGGADALVPADIGAAVTLSGTATLVAANWTGTAAPFVYELSAPGVSDSDAPLIDYVGGADAAAAELIKAGWLIAVSSYVKPMATSNKITFKAKEKPTVNVPMRWEVVR